METPKNNHIEQNVSGDNNIIIGSGDVQIQQNIPPILGAEKIQLNNLASNVKEFWIEGILKNSIFTNHLINIDKEFRNDLIIHPWEDVIEVPHEKINEKFDKNDILEVFNHCQRTLLILGEPGCGKTTTILELTDKLYQETPDYYANPLPVIFNPSSWNGKDSIFSWIVSEINNKYRVEKKFASKILKEGRLILLIDGLDELSHDLINNFITSLNDYASSYGLAGLVVSCRFKDYFNIEKRLKANGCIILKPLNEVQLKTYFQKINDKKLDIIQKRIEESPSLKRIVSIPLMLNIVLLVFNDKIFEGKFITKNKSISQLKLPLFEIFVQKMFSRKGNRFKKKAKTRMKNVLAVLAEKLRESKKIFFSLDDFQPSWIINPVWKFTYHIFYRFILSIILLLPIYLVLGDTKYILEVVSSFVIIGIVEVILNHPKAASFRIIIPWNPFSIAALSLFINTYLFIIISGYSPNFIENFSVITTIFISVIIWWFDREKLGWNKEILNLSSYRVQNFRLKKIKRYKFWILFSINFPISLGFVVDRFYGHYFVTFVFVILISIILTFVEILIYNLYFVPEYLTRTNNYSLEQKGFRNLIQRIKTSIFLAGSLIIPFSIISAPIFYSTQSFSGFYLLCSVISLYIFIKDIVQKNLLKIFFSITRRVNVFRIEKDIYDSAKIMLLRRVGDKFIFFHKDLLDYFSQRFGNRTIEQFDENISNSENLILEEIIDRYQMLLIEKINHKFQIFKSEYDKTELEIVAIDDSLLRNTKFYSDSKFLTTIEKDVPGKNQHLGDIVFIENESQEWKNAEVPPEIARLAFYGTKFEIKPYFSLIKAEINTFNNSEGEINTLFFDLNGRDYVVEAGFNDTIILSAIFKSKLFIRKETVRKENFSNRISFEIFFLEKYYDSGRALEVLENYNRKCLEFNNEIPQKRNLGLDFDGLSECKDLKIIPSENQDGLCFLPIEFINNEHLEFINSEPFSFSIEVELRDFVPLLESNQPRATNLLIEKYKENFKVKRIVYYLKKEGNIYSFIEVEYELNRFHFYPEGGEEILLSKLFNAPIYFKKEVADHIRSSILGVEYYEKNRIVKMIRKRLFSE